MSEKIRLAFCVHSHQPVGNFPAVFRKGSQDCYLPLLRILKDYPQIRMTLHYTGPLLEWFEANEPEFFELVSELVERSQIEIMGGGFYEPILPVIPQVDAISQIAYSRRYCEDKFGVSPTGMWCAERIWDPGVPEKIAGSGVEYTLLDDSHFLSAGLSASDVHGYYITEREGYSLKVFPVDMNLRYLIPFRQPHEVVEYLMEMKRSGVQVVTYGDDGEKFGMWPGTHKWVIQEGWLRRFFDEIIRASEDIEIVPLCRVIDTCPPRGRIYLPTASYQEMMEWSLFAEQGRVYEDLVKQAKEKDEWKELRGFLRGGMWDNFFAKYPESNLMHKKMLKISALVRQYNEPEDALDHLLMSQCNCAYWHGLFGGIYISSLRHAIYEHLLKAEAIVDRQRFSGTPWIVEVTDHDLDGKEEVLVSGKDINCYISPYWGASVFGLEFKPAAYNFSNILMRHPEIYHKDIIDAGAEHDIPETGEPLSIHDIPRVVADGYKDLLVYDLYPKYSFLTHYLEDTPSVETILKMNKIGSADETPIPFELASTVQDQGRLELVFRGRLKDIAIDKTYLFYAENTVAVSHAIHQAKEDSWVVVECNVMSVSEQMPSVDDVVLVENRGSFSARKVTVADTEKGVCLSVESDSPWDICIVPIECISQSEEGFEKTFQGWSIYFSRRGSQPIPEIRSRMEAICQS
ncbi:MAG TPA: DUF1926 domain-containing protein [Deltaproteobacteria bacterium]|nr:DUF1926 domain-containing protein [Deltaproteobacteria bacterium]